MDISWVQVGIAVGSIVFAVGGAWTAFVITTKHLKSRMRRIESELKEARDAESNLKTRYADDGHELESQLQRLETKLTTLQLDLAHRCQELLELKTSMSTVDGETTDAHKRVDIISSQLLDITRDIATTRQDLAVLKDGIASRLNYLAKAENAINELLINHGWLKVKVERNECDIQRLGQSIDALSIRVARVDSQQRGGNQE